MQQSSQQPYGEKDLSGWLRNTEAVVQMLQINSSFQFVGLNSFVLLLFRNDI